MIKKFLPFITIGFFMLVANLLLVLAIYEIRDVDVITLTTINFGIYVMSLFVIFSDSFSKLLTIKLSQTNSEDFKNLLFSTYIKMTPIFVLIISVVSAFFVLIYPEYLLLFTIIYSISLMCYVHLYLRACVNALENYFVLGLLLLPFPLGRVISGYLVANGWDYITVFWSLMISCLLTLVIPVIFLKKKYPKLLSIPQKFTEEVDIKNVLLNIGLQLAINTFWIFDGILLNKALSPTIYTTYTTFALIYKFPFFIASSFLLVILGENISSNLERKRFYKTVLRAILLVIGVFLPVIAFEYFNTGYIHYLIGYGKYYIDGISLFFGFAWLLQTLVFILYTTALKISPKNNIVITQIFISSLTFIVGLTVFSSTLEVLTLFLLFHGIIFFILSGILVLRLIKGMKD